MEGKDAEQGTGPKELSISRPTQFWIELERLKTEEGDKKQPEYFKSPFEETRSLDGIPEITAYTDTHSNSRQLSRYGYKGLASGKRMFYGLSKIPWIRNKARRIDVLSK